MDDNTKQSSSRNFKALIEEKKRKLELIKDARKFRTTSPLPSGSLVAKEVGSESVATPPLPLPKAVSSEEEINKLLQHFDSGLLAEKTRSIANGSSEDPTLGNSNTLQTSDSQSTDSQTKGPTLILVQVSQTDIPPKEKIRYSKEVQTAESGPQYATYSEDDESDDDNPYLADRRYSNRLPPGILPHGMPKVTDVKPALTNTEQEEQTSALEKPTELSQDEREKILNSAEFQSFMIKATAAVERLLSERNVDFCFDYGSAEDDIEITEEKSPSDLTLNSTFWDVKWSKNRCVTSLEWSKQNPEILLASYGSNPIAPTEPEGVCLMWNHCSGLAQTVFHCQSPVTSARFATFHPNLVLGGTYSGSVVLWDSRVDKKTPIQRSPLSTAAHTHPVYCLEIIGTEKSQTIVTMSTDGKLCTWSLEMLNQPLETLDLINEHALVPKPIAPTCVSFPQGNFNKFLVGSEDGNVYSGCLDGEVTGIIEVLEGHVAPVTGLSSHNVSGPVDFSHLYLTSSFDWSVKLWSLQESKPIHSFDAAGDYVYDVAWSPTSPSVFATVDGGGRLDLWNLNNDTEVSTAAVGVDSTAPVALSRVSWTPSGHHVTAGDDTGRIWLYDVGEDIAMPRQEDWTGFAHTVSELIGNHGNHELPGLRQGGFE